METLRPAFVVFRKPYFIYNKVTNEVRVYPTIVEPNSSDATTLDYEVEKPIEFDTIEEVMAEFDRLGFVMPESDNWDYPEKPLRIKLSDSDIVQLFKNIPPFRDYIDSMSDTTVARNSCQYIYLSEVYPEHKALLSTYSSFSLDERR
jgi:hypothetical protein